MNIIKNYLKYLRDNPQKLWFKRKMYGWGWVPVRWQGWLVVLIFILFVVGRSWNLDSEVELSGSHLMWFFIKLVLSILVLLFICYKTGEKPKWQWGKDKK